MAKIPVFIFWFSEIAPLDIANHSNKYAPNPSKIKIISTQHLRVLKLVL